MTVAIIPRIDMQQRKPVVFFPDTMSGDTIQCWSDGITHVVKVSYYHECQPLSADDTNMVRNHYSAANNNVQTVLRQRLPRVSRIDNVLASNAPKAAKAPKPAAPGLQLAALSPLPTPAPVPVPAPAAATPGSVAAATPADVLAAVQQLRREIDERFNQIEAMLTAH